MHLLPEVTAQSDNLKSPSSGAEDYTQKLDIFSPTSDDGF